MMIVTSIHEGFQNVPRLYGSDIRKSGKVTDLASGVREAGKVSWSFCSPCRIELTYSGPFLWLLRWNNRSRH